MAPRKPKRKQDDLPEGDRSLIEIGNDAGDHYVADLPTNAVSGVEKELRKAGVEPDTDELDFKGQPASRVQRMLAKRDSNQHRYRSGRVVDEGEDLEEDDPPEVDDWP